MYFYTYLFIGRLNEEITLKIKQDFKGIEHIGYHIFAINIDELAPALYKNVCIETVSIFHPGTSIQTLKCFSIGQFFVFNDPNLSKKKRYAWLYTSPLF